MIANSFERNLKYELLNLPLPQRQKRLKPGIIPTLNLPTIKDASTSATSDRGVKRPEQSSDSQQEPGFTVQGASTSATKKLKTDVTSQSSSHPSFINEETQLLQTINQHLYFQVVQLKQQINNLAAENNKLKIELDITRQQVEACREKQLGL
ncbi:hypothetical protein Pcinc_000504 [Petrolisthes cinctipes]|uniref:Uncharacterized protein n=1 Tax=Petrolisthes cinctipes TaxID=88211 RepID=A0AAE1L4E9_PETCI|nr:hypothetical protein Pcinc_000504 [Petrolisthes cinctipes]